MEFAIFSCGGGSIKAKLMRSSTLRDFNRSTTLAKLVRWISGTVVANNSAEREKEKKRKKDNLERDLKENKHHEFTQK